MAHTFEVTTKDAINVARGRETALLEAVLSLKSKQVTFTQIAAAAKTKMKTKQNFERIVARFIKELIAHKALKEVDK